MSNKTCGGRFEGGTDRRVVAIVGDGALTGGMCWEALNNIGGSSRPVVVLLNDNGRSYDPTTGGFAATVTGVASSRLAW
jgi:1-deoxy-D-xylulose-5-phosphate synthase